MPVTGENHTFNLHAVVYATDFSLCSQNAGLYAAFLAEFFSSRLLVTHAFTVSQAAMEVEVDHKLISQERRDLQSLLDRKAYLLGDRKIEAIPVLLDGVPKRVIPALMAEQAPSLLVLGTHGGGWVERGVIGSVAEQILRSTAWPSLTVGPQVPALNGSGLPFKRILYATDFTPSAAHAATYAVQLAEAFGSDFDVLNVIPQSAVDHPERLHELQDRFYSSLDHLIADHASELCNPRTFVDVGKAHHRVLQHVRDRAIDLLVLGIRKTSHLGLEMRTSGAFQLIVDAGCPVLTIAA